MSDPDTAPEEASASDAMPPAAMGYPSMLDPAMLHPVYSRSTSSDTVVEMDASQFYRGAGNNQAMSPTGMPIATMLHHASSSSASSDTVVENTPTPFHRFAGSNQAVADASDAMSLPAADDLPTVAELASSAFFRIASNNRSVDDLAYSESFRTMGKNPVTGVPLSHVYGPARINPYVTGGPYSKSSRTAGKNPFVAAGGAPHRHLSGAAGNNPFVPRVPSSRSSGAGNKPLVPGVPSSQSSGATGNSPFMAGVPDSLSFGAGPDPFVTEASYSQISRTEGNTPFVAETITCSQSSRTAGNSHVSPDAFGNNTSNTNNQEGTHGNRKTNTKTVPDDVLTFFAKMMFVSGETAEPSTETTTLIEEITRQQVIEILSRATALAARRGSRSILITEMIHLIRHDQGKVSRLKTFLSWKDVRKNVKDSDDKGGGDADFAAADDAAGAVAGPQDVAAKPKNKKAKVGLPWDINSFYSVQIPEREDEEDEEEEEQNYATLQRLAAADERTRHMTKEEYVFWSECRQASFTYRKSKRFREWAGFGVVTDSKPNDDIVDILGFMTFEIVQTLTEQALRVKEREDSERNRRGGANAGADLKKRKRETGLFDPPEEGRTPIEPRHVREAYRKLQHTPQVAAAMLLHDGTMPPNMPLVLI